MLDTNHVQFGKERCHYPGILSIRNCLPLAQFCPNRFQTDSAKASMLVTGIDPNGLVVVFLRILTRRPMLLGIMYAYVVPETCNCRTPLGADAYHPGFKSPRSFHPRIALATEGSQPKSRTNLDFTPARSRSIWIQATTLHATVTR